MRDPWLGKQDFAKCLNLTQWQGTTPNPLRL